MIGALILRMSLFVERWNVVDFVAVGALETNVHNVRAALHLTACNFGGFFPLFGGDEVLEEARADNVGPLADDQRPRGFFGLDHLDARIDGAVVRLWQRTRSFRSRHLRDRADVFFCGSAAATDDVQPAPFDEPVQLLRKRGWRFAVESIFVRAIRRSDNRRPRGWSAIEAYECGRS